MVTAERLESRDALQEAMGHMTEALAKIRRTGHYGKHDPDYCRPCARYVDIHANLDMLVVSWLEAEA